MPRGPRPLPRRIPAWGVWAALYCLAAVAPADAAKSEIERTHRGIELLGMPRPDKKYDTELSEPAAGVANLAKALDRIYEKSPFSVKHLETLKKNGKVTVVYDAGFPKKQLSSVTIGAFFPDFFQKEQGGLKHFLVVIGRFGAKWPTDDLAALIVHELVGHGLQHFRGRGHKDRKIDRECEALIYEEKSYQDFGVKRDTSNMIRFRTDMRTKWCGDFSRYLRDNEINVDKAWGFGKPDVPKLLGHFERYIQHLRETGIAGKAVAAAKAKRDENFTAFAAKAEKTKSAPDLLLVGKRYLKGIGVHRNARKAAAWVRKAADLGHGPAQHMLGALYAAGHGVKLDRIEAYKWYTLAIRGGFSGSKKYRAKLQRRLSSKQINEAKKRADAWRAEPKG